MKKKTNWGSGSWVTHPRSYVRKPDLDMAVELHSTCSLLHCQENKKKSLCPKQVPGDHSGATCLEIAGAECHAACCPRCLTALSRSRPVTHGGGGAGPVSTEVGVQAPHSCVASRQAHALTPLLRQRFEREKWYPPSYSLKRYRNRNSSSMQYWASINKDKYED